GAHNSSIAEISNDAKNGIIIKGGEVIDSFSKIDTIVFDKTCTLTKGQPEVTDFKLFTDESEDHLLQHIARAEMISEHHLGKTIVKKAEERSLELTGDVTDGKVIKGNGIRATVEGRHFIIGNRKLMHQHTIDITAEIDNYAVQREKKGNTAIFAAVDGKIVAIISIADEIREDAHRALAELRKNGIKKMIMLTGDNE